MQIEFATCNRSDALQFLQDVYPTSHIVDTPESAGPLLDLVEKDLIRIRDPAMYGSRIGVIPGTKFREEMREQTAKTCEQFHATALVHFDEV